MTKNLPLAINDMTRSSAIRYAYTCLEEAKADGWIFDWSTFRKITADGEKCCCLGGAIAIKNEQMFLDSLGKRENSMISYISDLCHIVRNDNDYGFRKLPSLEELLEGDKADLVELRDACIEEIEEEGISLS